MGVEGEGVEEEGRVCGLRGSEGKSRSDGGKGEKDEEEMGR